jgi:hypothetical protein
MSPASTAQCGGCIDTGWTEPIRRIVCDGSRGREVRGGAGCASDMVRAALTSDQRPHVADRSLPF